MAERKEFGGGEEGLRVQEEPSGGRRAAVAAGCARVLDVERAEEAAVGWR